MAEWIAVSESLPEAETDVLCVDILRHGEPPFVAGLFHGRWESFLDGGGDKEYSVSHWMPLPELPSSN